jgi:hypothetical protein
MDALIGRLVQMPMPLAAVLLKYRSQHIVN